MRLTIALPGLFWYDQGDIDYLYPKLNLPNLKSLLQHATMSVLNYSYSDLVYTLNDSQGSVAKSLANKMNLSHQHPSFLLAEPTHLRLDRDRLQIAEPDLLQLDEVEAKLIIQLINQHFAPQIKLYFITEHLWLVGHNLDLTGSTFHPILDIIGENIDDYLHNGQNAIQLNKLLNEIQMLFYNSPNNQTRINEGSLTVNSIWLWNKDVTLKTAYTNIYANSLPALVNHAKIHPIPQTIETAFVDNSLIIIDNLYYPCCYRDSFSWMDKLHELDTTLGAHLKHLLKCQSSTLNILIPRQEDTIQLHIRSKDKYKFWQNKQLINFVKESHAF